MVRRWSIPGGLELLAALVVGCAGLAFFAARASGGEAGRQDEIAADAPAQKTSPAADSPEEETAPAEEAVSEPDGPAGEGPAPEKPAVPGEAGSSAAEAKMPEPKAPRPGAPGVPRHRRRGPRGTPLPGALGVRLGYIVPGQGQAEFSGGLICGLYYRAGRKEQKLGHEVGIDFSTSRSVDGVAAAGQIWGRAAALYRPVDDRSFYVLGGGGMVGELYEDGSHYVNGSVVLAAVDLGLGLTVVEGKLDVRATYSLFLGSRNVPGAARLMVGYSF